MRLERNGCAAAVKARKIDCLRDKQGRFIGKVFEAQADRLVGRGAATVFLVRPGPRRIPT